MSTQYQKYICASNEDIRQVMSLARDCSYHNPQHLLKIHRYTRDNMPRLNVTYLMSVLDT